MRGVCIARYISYVLWPFIQHSLPLYVSSTSPLHLFSHPPAPGLCRLQMERAFGVEVLLAFRPPLGLSFADRLGVASAASGFPSP